MLVASTDLGWIQLASDNLTGIFYQVGLQKNACKTVGVMCKPCLSDRVRADEAHTLQMMGGGGRSFKEIQQERVVYPKCRKEISKGSLVLH